MFSITIAFGPGPVLWRLLFQNQERAQSAYDICKRSVESGEPSMIAITDDFGQDAYVDPANVHGMMFEDMTRSQLGNCEYTLHQARGQAKTRDMADNDQVLKVARTRHGSGPAILSPMGGGPNGPWQG